MNLLLLKPQCIHMQELIRARNIMQSIEFHSDIYKYIQKDDFKKPLNIFSSTTKEKIYIYVMKNEDEIKENFILLNNLESHEFAIILSDIPKNNQFKYNTQVFYIEDFSFNVTKHILVPKHEIFIRNTEIQKKRAFYKKINILSDNQLPVILTTDPLVVYYGMQVGDICKITRMTNNVSYRIVSYPDYNN